MEFHCIKSVPYDMLVCVHSSQYSLSYKMFGIVLEIKYMEINFIMYMF